MRLTPLVKKVLVGSAFAGAFVIGVPHAQAAELPSVPEPLQLPEVSAVGLVDHIRGELARAGVVTPEVPEELTRAVDDSTQAVKESISSVVAQQNFTGAVPQWEVPRVELPTSAALSDQADALRLAHLPPTQLPPVQQLYGQAEPATNPAPLGLDTLTQPDFKPVNTDPNYVWRNDLFSKVAAGKPFADYVLHRAPGSYFDAPRIPEESNRSMTQGKSLYGPGTPIYVNERTMCTLTMAGVDEKGRKVGITAGHCAKVGDNIASADSWQVGNSGTVVAKNAELDYAVIEFGSNADVTPSYNGVTAYGIGGALPTTGENVCKRGVATGTTCGITFTTGPDMQFNQVCATVGDSGAPVFYRGRIIGSVSGGYTPLGFGVSCITPLQGAMHVPTITNNSAAVLKDLNDRGGVGAGFHLAHS